MWKVQALVVHLLLLGSILSIYFQSTLLSGLEPLPTLLELGQKPPADRVVVFVSDGLRAESVLRDNCSLVPDLQKLFVEQGLMGISTAYCPTVTRPGLIAIFAGFSEDPAAALTNFGWNPSTYDTVLNRSRNTFGWVDTNVAGIFGRLPTGGTPLHLTTFSKTDLSGQLENDEWVFGQVRQFLTSEHNVRSLLNATSLLFFVYLPDVDSVGHAKGPTSSKFREKLLKTQLGIRMTYELFESVFNDNRTAYILTADHGMTDTAHGGGGEVETETPFIFWGAGVNRHVPSSGQTFVANNKGRILPLHQLYQVQLAPLISALIGLPPPMNNQALLPTRFLNISKEYKFYALHLNAFQLLLQARIVVRRHEQGIFYPLLSEFEELNSRKIEQYEGNVKDLLNAGKMEQAAWCSQQMAKLAQKCLEYYHDYYHTPLLWATTASYLAWFYCLLMQLSRQPAESKPARRGHLTWTTLAVSLVMLVILVALILQKVPWLTTLYLLLPLGMLILALGERPLMRSSIQFPILHVIGVVLPAGLLILMAFKNNHIGLLYGLGVCLGNARAFGKTSAKFFTWLALVILLSLILVSKQNPWMDWLIKPLSNYVKDIHVLFASMVLSVIRTLILKHRHVQRVWVINTTVMLFAAYGSYQWEQNSPICTYVYAASWSYFFYAFFSIPYSGTINPRRRLELITFNMLTLHILLTTSTGSLVAQTMITEFSLGLELRQESERAKQVKDRDEDEEQEEEYREEEDDKEEMELELESEQPLTRVQHLKQAYRCAIYILLYFYVAFFGTGHWFFNFRFKAYISRLFLSSFSLHLSVACVLLKIFIPSIIVLATIYALVPFGRKNTRSIFICLFLMNDAMSLYFCYYVNNSGSWEKVRQSLDYLLVTHIFIILLLGCSWIAKAVLSKTAGEKRMTGNEVTVLENSATLVEDSQA
ncbi:hypothetical protein KR009_004588 [Drosophila setifemur]|nr:hypothetical protein KR009_004588 [Drosophila setifemur]